MKHRVLFMNNNKPKSRMEEIRINDLHDAWLVWSLCFLPALAFGPLGLAILLWWCSRISNRNMKYYQEDFDKLRNKS